MQFKSLSQNKTVHGTIIFLCVVIFFVAATILAERYENELTELATNDSVLGMLIYTVVSGVAVVVAPVSTLPLIPLAVGIWGWFITGVLSIIGWTIGSQIAFYLARGYGKNLVKKFASLERFTDFEKRFSTKNLFWTIVLLRMTVPVDVLSYALGLFSHMTSRSYFLATIIGITPFAFIFSYLGSLPPGFQFIMLIEIALLVLLFHFLQKKKTE
jgi:uncharacterized membrane protein YdjX (TVP38/TMEM64 family)